MKISGVIDFDHLEKYVSGDDGLRDEILEIFASQVEVLLNQFDVFQSDDNWTETAHTLKGASRGVGAWDLGELCEEAEKLVGAAPAKSESRATLLVSLRIVAHSAVNEARQFGLAVAS